MNPAKCLEDVLVIGILVPQIENDVKTLKTKTNFLALLFAIAGPMTAQVLMTDPFDGLTVDTSKWSVMTPFSDSFVTQSGGYVQVEDGGRITTQSAFTGAFEITGRIQLSNNAKNNSKIVLRTDGAQYFSEVKGVAVQFSPQLDNGSFANQLGIFTIGELSQISTSLTTPLSLDTWYDFRIVDTGTSIALYWNGAITPTLSLTTSYRAGSKVSFYVWSAESVGELGFG